MRQFFAIIVSAVVLTSCAKESVREASLMIDLNRTAKDEMTLTALMNDSIEPMKVGADANGTYVMSTRELPTGLYVARWDSAHILPLLIHCGEELKVCGTWQKWDSLQTTSQESRLLWEADNIRRRLNVARDSAMHCEGRKAQADSINVVRRMFRAEADGLLEEADTSLAALAVIGLRDLYDAVEDYDMMMKIVADLSARYPRSMYLENLEKDMIEVRKYVALRRRYSAGQSGPKFQFVHGSKPDTLTASSYYFYKKRYAIALLPDSSERTNRAIKMLEALQEAGGRVVAKKGANVPLQRKYTCLVGDFVSIENENELKKFAPVVIEVDNTDGEGRCRMYNY